MLANADTDRVFQSYGRCCQHEAFFETFYRIFLDKSDEVRAMFEHTDMAEQRRLLRPAFLADHVCARRLGCKAAFAGRESRP